MGPARQSHRSHLRPKIQSRGGSVPAPSVLGSTVAHHDSVGTGAADRFPVFPLLATSLSLEADSLADQLTFTRATGANGPDDKSFGGEFGSGGSSEVHCGCVVGVRCAAEVNRCDEDLPTRQQRIHRCRLLPAKRLGDPHDGS